MDGEVSLAGIICSCYVLSMFDPRFDPNDALFIIWRRPRAGGIHTVAAGSFNAMIAAWRAVQEDYPDDELSLQNRARILMRREMIRGHTS